MQNVDKVKRKVAYEPIFNISAFCFNTFNLIGKHLAADANMHFHDLLHFCIAM